MSYKILLADDSVTVQKIITLTFSDEGVDVLTVNNGNDAVNRLQYMRPALVMADVSLPGRNGYEICEFVKNHPEMKNTPVILLVPAFETFDDERAQQVGADHHLIKPFQSIRTLIATVKNLIERKASPVSVAEQAKSASSVDNADLINGKSAKIEELIKKSTAPLPPVEFLAQASPLEIAEDDPLASIDLMLPTFGTPGAASARVLAVTEIEDEFVFGADVPLAIASDLAVTSARPTGNGSGDNVLELDDVLPELHLPVAHPQAPVEPVQSSIAPLATATVDEQQIPQRVIDEIVARIVAQLSTQLSDELAEKLTERLTRVSRELADHVAPQVAEILQTQRLSSYRITENLLEID